MTSFFLLSIEQPTLQTDNHQNVPPEGVADALLITTSRTDDTTADDTNSNDLQPLYSSPPRALFLRLGISRKVYNPNLIPCFIRGIQPHAACPSVCTLRVTIPVVPGYSDPVPRLKSNLVRATWLVLVHRDLVVGVLTSEVVDVVERVVPARCVRMQRLHDLIRHSAHLQTLPLNNDFLAAIQSRQV